MGTNFQPPIQKDRQYRQFHNFELRAEPLEAQSGSALIIEGLATPFNTPTVLYEYDGIQYKEQIDARAFDGADMSDVIFNYNHAGKVIARTRNKTLQVWTEPDGLHMRARVDGTDEGRRIYEEIKGGYIDRMSFAFHVPEGGAEYDMERHLRTVLKVRKLYDVSAVDMPAYDTTSISARSFFEAELERERNAADAAELRREVLKAEIALSQKIYGGYEE